MNIMARANSEGLSVGYRILYRIRYLGLHVFGQLGDTDDPHARMRRERARKVTAARRARHDGRP